LSKRAAGIMLTLLLIGMLTLTFNIKQVGAWWYGTIYIRADGSVEPSTAPIQRDGDIYTLTDDISAEYNGIEIARSNMVLDGAGFTVKGNFPYATMSIGIYLYGVNVTVKNMEIRAFYRGIDVSASNRIYGNNITNCSSGIVLRSENNILRNNTMTNNQYNFFVDRGLFNDVDVSNSVDGKPIYYWVNKQQMAVPLDAGCVVLVKCTRITVQDLNLTNNWAGVLLGWTENSTITKNKIANNYYGIYLSYSSNNSLFGNNITNNWGGIDLWNSKCNSLNRNNITNNDCGITLSGLGDWYGSSNNNIYGNTITNNSYYGVALWEYSNNNAINGNNITNNSYGIKVGGSSNIISENMINDNKYNLDVSGDLPSHSIDASNLVNGKPVYYLVSQKDLVINPATYPQIGYLALVDCANVTVEGLTLTNNGQGILISNTNNSKITGNNITNNSLGISLICSSNSLISRNNITNNEAEGGIYLSGCSSNSIHENNIAKNEFGIFLGDSSNNRVYENNITANKEYGIFLCNSYNNSVYGNNIINNMYGVRIDSVSTDNILCHNNFVNNTYQVESYDSTNIWDDGYPSGGNYWSDYEDRYSDAKEINESGIWDTPYVIDEYNQDRYPLINPWTPPEHELVVSIMAPASIMLGGSSLLNATVSNEGSYDEVDVELLILVNSTIVNSTTVPRLQAGQSYTYTYVWTPTVEGIHNITAYVHPVVGEIYTGNNQETTFVIVSGFHELEVALKVPTRLALGDSSLINATLSNLGTYKEQNVTFRIFVDNTIVNSTTIPFLEAGSSHTISYIWTPTVEGAYNVTVYVSPVLGETSIENNQDTKFITVVQVGVEAGDWVKYDYTVTGWPAGTPYPKWLKVEFLSVEGTNATVRVTMRMSDGTEQNATVPVDVVAGGQAFGLSGFVIPANLTTGDIIFMSGYGNVTIAGETRRTYAGASRTVVYASFSQYGTQLTYYWDKQTGVMVEASVTSGTMTGTGKATETNMWQAAPSGLPIEPIYLYILTALVIIIAVGAAAFIVRRKKKPPEVESPQSQKPAHTHNGDNE
jgi:parallel beta-helix repeat protein